MKICTNILYLINSGIVSQVILTTTPIYTCDEICGQLIPVYGLCKIDLNYGYLNNNINNTKYCVKPFIFNDYECVCSPGYLLNGTICINILSTLTNINQYILDNISMLDHNLNNNISNISNKLEATKDYLYNYFTSEINNFRQVVNTSLDDIYNQHNQFKLIVTSNISSLQIQTKNLQSNITAHKVISDQLRVDLQSVNSTLNSQIQSVITSLQTVNNSLQSQINSNLASLSSITSQFTSFRSDAISNHSLQNTQIQNLVTTTNTQKTVSDQLRADLTSSTNSLQTQINSLNSNLQGTNNQVSTISSSLSSAQNNINSLQTQINSINSVNTVQNSDIATLKTQIADSGGSGALMCSLVFSQYGYCLNVKKCCVLAKDEINTSIYKCKYYDSGYNYNGMDFGDSEISIADCGPFTQI
ncbi:Hypothetical_protein [Hexamita inflata]|uniref:Hypothetical_protein n=1 Tax=Hexamita inflata TaxID=28002 RepID=A0AA86PBG1_9EUKA|nr:Hypothetical protein HINF_LOCUS23346 [Hexamita inflata]